MRRSICNPQVSTQHFHGDSRTHVQTYRGTRNLSRPHVFPAEAEQGAVVSSAAAPLPWSVCYNIFHIFCWLFHCLEWVQAECCSACSPVFLRAGRLWCAFRENVCLTLGLFRSASWPCNELHVNESTTYVQQSIFTQKHTHKPRSFIDQLMKMLWTRGSQDPNPTFPLGAVVQCSLILFLQQLYGA